MPFISEFPTLFPKWNILSHNACLFKPIKWLNKWIWESENMINMFWRMIFFFGKGGRWESPEYSL